MQVVLFDGVCALCSASVRWLIAVDARKRLHYAPLQGETGQKVLSRHPHIDRSLSTIVYVRGFDESSESLYERSDAAFEILRDLGGVWKVVSWLRWVPRGLRDGVYKLIANRRYRWFGRYESCQLPGSGDPSRFLP